MNDVADQVASRNEPRSESNPASPRPKERPVREERDRGEPPKPADGATAEHATTWRATLRRHPWVTGIVVILLIAVVAAAILWWLHARNYESTDDAFIDTHWIPISAQVKGAIAAVAVTDNQVVAAGTDLVRIDPRDYTAAVDQAKAQVDAAQASVANLDAQIDAQQARIDQAKTQVTEAQAALKFSREENQRYQDLLKRGAGTEQRAQQASSDLQQKQAQANAAIANEVAAEKQIAVLKTQRQSAVAQVAQARATLEQAQADLARTVVKAPIASRVTQLSAVKGAYAQPGQALMILVPQHVWVTANFKETQLAEMHPGQPVDISIDAYGKRTFHGHVESIQAGSGTVFSLLPPENATGNYVKVVQRVPVKIVFDQPPDVLLGPGMSVVPTVRVR